MADAAAAEDNGATESGGEARYEGIRQKKSVRQTLKWMDTDYDDD